MKKQSETRPETLQPVQGGCTEFNWNVTEKDGGYEYDSVDVVGEVVRVNVKYAMMLELHTADEINEMENVKRTSTDPEDIAAYAAYKAEKDSCNAIITAELGENFK